MEDAKWLSDAELLSRIGAKIKEWRLESNLSQQTIAERAQLSLITFQHIEHGKGGSAANYLRVLRVLDRLDALAPFLEERHIPPIEYQKFVQGLKQRKRATKKDYAANEDSAPVW